MTVTERAKPSETVSRGPLPAVDAVLEKASGGERISDDDAVALLRSRDLVSVGRVANEIRSRLNDPQKVTFIVDRNLNYTNVCVTDAISAPSIGVQATCGRGTCCRSWSSSRKSRRRSSSAARASSCRAVTIPISGSTTTRPFPLDQGPLAIHLHALSPPEIQHIARRSKLTVAETLTRLRDAGLDSVPGGGAEILVDRVRRIIAPKKTKSDEWLDVMRQAHRLGCRRPRR